ncbi:hypothetical protein ABE073_04340 [Lederbergia citrisecunda]|uniref:hypothetical protein n=1 Tax=Lederbergia citrisecunda TaxID=2833583 RepID=UPI003D29796F
MKRIVISVKGGKLTITENEGNFQVVIIDKDADLEDVIELSGKEDVIIELCKGARDVKKCREDLELIFINVDEDK